MRQYKLPVEEQNGIDVRWTPSRVRAMLRVPAPAHPDQSFRSIPIRVSRRSRSGVPIDPDHAFQSIPISVWRVWRGVTAPVGD